MTCERTKGSTPENDEGQPVIIILMITDIIVINIYWYDNIYILMIVRLNYLYARFINRSEVSIYHCQPLWSIDFHHWSIINQPLTDH